MEAKLKEILQEYLHGKLDLFAAPFNVSKDTVLHRVDSSVGEVHFLFDGIGFIVGVYPDNIDVKYCLGHYTEYNGQENW